MTERPFDTGSSTTVSGHRPLAAPTDAGLLQSSVRLGRQLTQLAEVRFIVILVTYPSKRIESSYQCTCMTRVEIPDEIPDVIKSSTRISHDKNILVRAPCGRQDRGLALTGAALQRWGLAAAVLREQMTEHLSRWMIRLIQRSASQRKQQQAAVHLLRLSNQRRASLGRGSEQ